MLDIMVIPTLFLKSELLNFMDLVNYKTVHIFYSVRHNLLPGNIENIFFQKKEGGRDLRGILD